MKNIFLIDDDLDDREIFEEALMSLDFKSSYTSARDGLEALDLVKSEKITQPDFIFLDLNMPRMGGLEFLQKLREYPDYAKVPVYIYSTSSAKSDVDNCMNAGATGFITKHDSFDDLCETLKSLLA